MFSKRGNQYRIRPNTALVFALFILVSLLSCKTPSIIATQAIQQGDAANNQNNYSLAIQHYSTYLETAPSLGVMRNHAMEADVCRKLAHAYSTQGQYSRAKDYLNQALELDNNQQDNLLNIIEDYRELGLTNIYLGDYKEALAYLDKALSLNEGMESSIKAVKKISIADTYLSKAQLELAMGLMKQAMDDAKRAESIYRKENPNGVGIIEATLVIGKIYITRNNLDSAKIYISQSKQISLDQGFKVFRQLQALGDVQLLDGDPEGAAFTKIEALAEAEASNIIPQIIWANIRVGDIYEVLGNERKANEYYKKAQLLQNGINASSSLTPSLQLRLGDVQHAYDLYSSRGAILGANIATLKLAEIQLMENEYDSLLLELEAVAKYFEEEKILEGEAKSYLLLSMLSQNLTDYREAVNYLNRAEAINTGQEILWKIYYNRGKIAQGEEKLDSARLWYDRSIQLIEEQRNEISSSEFKWHYLDKKVDVYDDYITLLLNQHEVSSQDVVKAFELNERARSRTFLDMLNNQSNPSGNTLIDSEREVSNEIIQIKNLIASYQLKGISTEDLSLRLDHLLKDLTKIRARLSISDPDYIYLKTIAPVQLKDLQGILDKETALLEYWVGKNYLVSWKITNSSITYTISPTDKMQIKQAVTKARNLIKFGIEDRIVDGFAELYQILNPSLQDIFKGYSKVVLIPHGSLHFIPFNALYDGKKFIVEYSQIQYSPSSSIFHYSTTKNSVFEKQNLFGMALGGVKLGEYSELPGTTMELEQLSQFYTDNNCIYEEELTESYFKANAQNYSIVHVATHGVMNQFKPGRSYILMSPTSTDDGQLSVEEIYDIELNARLVTLSACETGLGDLSEGDELVGLSRAFLYAGASTVIVSLWKVDDISTSILMTKMHQLVEGGIPIAAALNQAQRDLLNSAFHRSTPRGAKVLEWNTTIADLVKTSNQKYTSPYYWAPFVVIGGNK